MNWKLLNYFYKTESWGDHARMYFPLLVLMDGFRASLPPGCKIKIHRGFSPKNDKSLHVSGKAVDFHVVGCGFIESEYHLKNYLIRKNLMNEIEYGIYPDWNDPGFHVGIQKNGGTWCGRYVLVDKNNGKVTEQQYFGYKDGIEYAKRKFSKVS